MFSKFTKILVASLAITASISNSFINTKAAYFLDPPRADGYAVINESGLNNYYIYGFAPKDTTFEVVTFAQEFTGQPSQLIWDYNNCPYNEYTNGIDNTTVQACYWRFKFDTQPTVNTNMHVGVRTSYPQNVGQDSSPYMYVGYNGAPDTVAQNKSHFNIVYSSYNGGNEIQNNSCKYFAFTEQEGFNFSIKNDTILNNTLPFSVTTNTQNLKSDNIVDTKPSGLSSGNPLKFDVFLDDIKVTPSGTSYDSEFGGVYISRLSRYTKKVEFVSYDNNGNSTKKTVYNCNEQPVNQASKIDFVDQGYPLSAYIGDINSDAYKYEYEYSVWYAKNQKAIPAKTNLNLSSIYDSRPVLGQYINIFYADAATNEIKYQYENRMASYGWSNPTSTNMYTTKSFAAVNHLGTYNMFYVGLDNKVHTKYFSDGAWLQDRIVPTTNNVSQVQVLVDGEYINLFYLDSVTNEVSYVYTKNGNWSNPIKLTGLTTNKKFFVVNHLGTYNAFYIDLDGSLKRVWFNGKDWVDKTQIAGESNIIDVSGFVENDYINIAFIRSTDNIPRYRYTNNGQWSNPTEIR